MDGDGVIGRQRHTVRTVSRKVSIAIAAKTLRLSNLTGVIFKSLAPVRKLMQRRKPLWSAGSSNFRSKFAERILSIPVIRESRKARSSFSKVQSSLRMKNVSERGKLGYRYTRHDIPGVATGSRVLRTGRPASSKTIGVRLSKEQIGTRRSALIGGRLTLRRNKENYVLPRKDLDNAASSATFAIPVRPLTRLKDTFSRRLLKLEREQDGARPSQKRSQFKILARKTLNLSNHGNFETQRSVSPNNTIGSGGGARSYQTQMQDRVAPVLQSKNITSEDQMLPPNFGLQRHHVGEIVRDLLTADARRPPSGVAAFDTRSAPIWPGRKPGF